MLTIELAHLINMLNFINQCSTKIEMGEFNSTSCNLLNSQGGNTVFVDQQKLNHIYVTGFMDTSYKRLLSHGPHCNFDPSFGRIVLVLSVSTY